MRVIRIEIPDEIAEQVTEEQFSDKESDDDPDTLEGAMRYILRTQFELEPKEWDRVKVTEQHEICVGTTTIQEVPE